MATSFTDAPLDENSSEAAEAEAAPELAYDPHGVYGGSDPHVAALLAEREGYLRKLTVPGADSAKWTARAELVEVELAKAGYVVEGAVERAEAPRQSRGRATRK